MTTAEVAQLCRVDQSTVRRWASEGRIKPVRLPGRLLRFRREDVEAALSAEPTAGAA